MSFPEGDARFFVFEDRRFGLFFSEANNGANGIGIAAGKGRSLGSAGASRSIGLAPAARSSGNRSSSLMNAFGVAHGE